MADAGSGGQECRGTAHNWIKAGKIVSIKFGRTRRIPAEEYERVVREGVPEDNGAKLTPDLASA
jgi:hypothetical protein